jgi:hypothetical protein
VTKTDDSHAFLFSKLTSLNQYGRENVPVQYSYAEGNWLLQKYIRLFLMKKIRSKPEMLFMMLKENDSTEN